VGHFQFQNEEELRAQRISDAEARRVVELWAQEQREQASQPTVEAVAEGLDIPPSEVARLLARARAESRESARGTSVRHGRGPTRVRLLAAAAAGLAAALLLMVIRQPHVAQEATLPALERAMPTGTGQEHRRGADGSVVMTGRFGTYSRRSDGSVSLRTREGTYEYRADGSLRITTPQGNYVRNADGSLEVRGPNGIHIRRADGSEERMGTPPVVTPPAPPPGITLPAVP